MILRWVNNWLTIGKKIIKKKDEIVSIHSKGGVSSLLFNVRIQKMGFGKSVDGKTKQAGNRNKRCKVKKEIKRQEEDDDEGEGREEAAAA